ncbi:MAG TPA: putative baseplate assembly protein, partial [Terriglobales bacterium]|nr:putative baseplate assembly protein [Terriglobales bacterium]
ADGVTNLSFIPADPTMAKVSLNPGDVLTVISPPAPNTDGTVPDWSSSSTSLQLNVQDASGRPGTVTAALNNFVLMPSASTDPEVQEYALVNTVVNVAPPSSPFPHTQIQLQSNLANCYNRAATTVNANVGLATCGQSVSEILGSGSASTPNQNFTLKQSPLTYVQATTGSGSQSTLQIEVNQVEWSEVPTLYGQGPAQLVFSTLNQSDGTTDVLFGDGVEGSTLPTGQNNVMANYRVGSGSSGNVAAGAITTLMDRPLGVKGVNNPSAATGGQDPQAIDDIRSNAPQTVLTLGRAVSITDYQNFATTFAGIAKAYAIWIPSGPGRGVFLTVAGVGGAALDPNGSTVTDLATALQNCGNPLVPVTVQSYVETLFSFSASVKYDPTYDQPTVQANVMTALSDAFGFDARTFGQSVGIDEITAVIQGVDGVVAVNVSGLTRETSSTAGDWSSLKGSSTISGLRRWLSHTIIFRRPVRDTAFRLCANLPVASTSGLPQPAEILVLDTSQVVLGVMS